MESDLGLNPGSATYYLCDHRQVTEPHFSDMGNTNNNWLVEMYSPLQKTVGESIGDLWGSCLIPKSFYSPSRCNHMAKGGLLFYKIRQSKLVTFNLLS